MSEEFILELARLVREAEARVAQRMSEQQLGEAFTEELGYGDTA